MVKTFITSPFVGAIAAVLGWLAALFFQNSMTDAAFADLRFGWTGSMVAGTALATLVLIWFFTDRSVEPLVASVCAAIGAAMLWDRRELPFNTSNFDRASDNYWFAVAFSGLAFVLLLLGLRTARSSNSRVR